MRAACVPALVLVAVPVAAQSWPTFFSAYLDGLEAQKRGDPALAAQAFVRAIALEPQPGRRVKTYGLNFLVNYYPYLRLAESDLDLGDLSGAEAALAKSQARAAEPAAEREALQQRLSRLRGTPGPAAPASSAPPPAAAAAPAPTVAAPATPPAGPGAPSAPPAAPSPAPAGPLPAAPATDPAAPARTPALSKTAGTPAAAPSAAPARSPAASAPVPAPVQVPAPAPPASGPAPAPEPGQASAGWWRTRTAGIGLAILAAALAGAAARHQVARRRSRSGPGPEPGTDPLTGTAVNLQFGPFAAHRVLGRGSCATAYYGRHRDTGAEVAIKVPHPHLVQDAGFRARFRLEALLGTRLDHPRVVRVVDPGPSEGDLWLAMTYLRGTTLEAHLARGGPLPAARAVAIARDIAEAIAYAHGKGIVHRDLKPGNVMLNDQGATVMDFGIARILDTSMTTGTMFLGTPLYCAPECLTGLNAGPPADRYALGVILFEMLAGHPPFQGESLFGVFEAQKFQPLPDLAALCPRLPPRLVRLVQRLCAKAPEDRPEDGETLAILDELAVLEQAGGTPVSP
jgi:hypothetical protein